MDQCGGPQCTAHERRDPCRPAKLGELPHVRPRSKQRRTSCEPAEEEVGRNVVLPRRGFDDRPAVVRGEGCGRHHGSLALARSSSTAATARRVTGRTRRHMLDGHARVASRSAPTVTNKDAHVTISRSAPTAASTDACVTAETAAPTAASTAALVTASLTTAPARRLQRRRQASRHLRSRRCATWPADRAS